MFFRPRRALPRFVRQIPLVLGLLASQGCACFACRDANLPASKALASPMDTTDLFRYAVRNGCWGVAYDCLDGRTREEVGYWSFRLLFCNQKYPGTDQSVCELIKAAESLPTTQRMFGAEGRLRVLSGHVLVDLSFVKEGERWKLDLLGILRANAPEDT